MMTLIRTAFAALALATLATPAVAQMTPGERAEARADTREMRADQRMDRREIRADIANERMAMRHHRHWQRRYGHCRSVWQHHHRVRVCR